jgi:hypothetical protein
VSPPNVQNHFTDSPGPFGADIPETSLTTTPLHPIGLLMFDDLVNLRPASLTFTKARMRETPGRATASALRSLLCAKPFDF